MFNGCDRELSSDQDSEGYPFVADIHLSTTSTQTRWTDSRTTDNEMMQRWTIIVTDTSNKIEKIFNSNYSGQVKEEDLITGITLTSGNKRFYTFANIDMAQIASTTPTVGSTLNLKASCNAFANGAIPTGGIPMSNMQTINVTNAQQQTIKLQVVRMMAKVTLQLANVSASAVKINSITLNSITPNSGVIPTLPTATINKSAVAANYTYTLSTPLTIAANTSASNAIAVSFYLNESAVSTTDTPPNFTISLNTDQGSQTQSLRYALLNWQVFKRNQYSIIPITIDDYQLKIAVVDYPPIGVYPAAVSTTGDGSFTCTIRSNGDFEIYPTLTKYSDGSTINFTLASKVAKIVPTGFFVTAPTYNSATKEIIGTIGNVSGTALYELTFNALKADGSLARTLTYQLYIKR